MQVEEMYRLILGIEAPWRIANVQLDGKPGYEGYLNDRVVPVAKVLREAGYHTYWAGKSHMGYEPSQWPAAMGFERDFTLLQGGGSNWSDMTYPNPAHPKLTFTLNGKPLDKLPDDHFSSEAYTDFIIKSNEEHKADGKPFFAYLSFQAVHSPFAAPDDWLDKYKGVYDKGYDAIRAERLARMKELGIVSKETVLSPRLPMIPAWDDLTPEQKQLSARRMEVYAAMLANMDHHIGRLVGHLKQTGQYENTVLVFFSDNAEGRLAFGVGEVQEFMGGRKQRPVEFGVSGVAGQIRISKPVPDSVTPRLDRIVDDVWAAGCDLQWAATDRLGMKGELFIGQTLGEYNAGALQNYNSETYKPVRTKGAYVEIYCYLHPQLHLHCGFGIDDPIDNDLAAGQIASNQTFFNTLLWDLSRTVQFGLEVDYRTTSYVEPLKDASGLLVMTQFLWRF